MTMSLMDFGRASYSGAAFPWPSNAWEVPRTFGSMMETKLEIVFRPITMTAGSVRAVLTEFTRDVTGKPDSLAQLAALAEAQDGPAFARQVAGMNWDIHAASEIAQVVRWALAAGAPLPARHISAEGHRLYPEDVELANMARILAPPKVLGVSPANPSAGRDLEWLRQHADEHRGQWVALRNGDFLAAAPTARELKAVLPRIQGIFVTRVA